MRNFTQSIVAPAVIGSLVAACLLGCTDDNQSNGEATDDVKPDTTDTSLFDVDADGDVNPLDARSDSDPAGDVQPDTGDNTFCDGTFPGSDCDQFIQSHCQVMASDPAQTVTGSPGGGADNIPNVGALETAYRIEGPGSHVIFELPEDGDYVFFLSRDIQFELLIDIDRQQGGGSVAEPDRTSPVGECTSIQKALTFEALQQQWVTMIFGERGMDFGDVTASVGQIPTP